MNNNIVKIVLVASFLLISISNCTAAENEFGIVYAWSNGEPATVEGMILKINEPFTVKATVESKIDGNIYVQLYEPGVTNAYEVVEGPSEIDEFIDNMKIESGWKTSYVWKLKPNGDWTNGNLLSAHLIWLLIVFIPVDMESRIFGINTMRYLKSHQGLTCR